MANMTPMMRQYLEMKDKYPGMILFFRLGDFYEMFFDDAKLVSRELELTLTGKSCGLEERAPMCGVPFHSAETYINRLIEKGYKVAICEQMEDPATAKGLVKRDVIRVVTPGTVIEQSMLDECRNNYILSVCMDGEHAGLAFADVSTVSFIYMKSKKLQRGFKMKLCGSCPKRLLPMHHSRRTQRRCTWMFRTGCVFSWLVRARRCWSILRCKAWIRSALAE